MRVLVFDIGNTQIKMGVYDDMELKTSWRLTTASSKTTDEYGVDMLMLLEHDKIDPESIDAVAVSSVVPTIMHSFTSAIVRYIGKEPLVIGPGVRTGVNIRVPNPQEVGADIIADVAAAVELYGGPCIILDFGTATKYLVVNERNELTAAVFSPGIGISAEALTSKAAQLPSFAIQKPKSILTCTTVECMQAGIVYGYIGQVKYICEQIRKEMGNPDMKVIATGGFGKIMVPELECIETYDSTLTLKGVRLIAERNLDGKRRKKKA